MQINQNLKQQETDLIQQPNNSLPSYTPGQIPRTANYAGAVAIPIRAHVAAYPTLDTALASSELAAGTVKTEKVTTGFT